MAEVQEGKAQIHLSGKVMLTKTLLFQLGVFILGERCMEKSETEVDVLRNVCEEAKQGGKITGEHLTRLTTVFGSRLLKAWEALKDERVKRYTFKPSGRVVWIVVGRARDYLIMPAADFCSCDDFYFNIMDRKAHLCYHLIAQKMADSLGWYDKIEEGDDLYDVLMKEWRKVTA